MKINVQSIDGVESQIEQRAPATLIVNAHLTKSQLQTLFYQIWEHVGDDILQEWLNAEDKKMVGFKQLTTDKCFVYDGINGELEECKNIYEAKTFIRENFIDEKEGIHPDIESVIILKQVMNTVVEEIVPSQGEPHHKVEFKY